VSAVSATGGARRLLDRVTAPLSAAIRVSRSIMAEQGEPALRFAAIHD